MSTYNSLFTYNGVTESANACVIPLTIGSITFNVDMAPGNSFFLLMNPEEVLSHLSARQSESSLQGAHGTKSSVAFYGPRTLPFSVEIHALTFEERVAMEQVMRGELALPENPDYAGDDGYRLITFTDEDGIDKQLYARIIQPPGFAKFAPNRPQSRIYDFVMYAEDPRIYAVALQSSSGGEATRTTNSTIQDGHLPTIQDGALPTIQDVAIHTVIALNTGVAESLPVITVTGPTENPVVKNETTGKAMYFTITLANGETLEIDTSAHAITKTSSGVKTDASGSLVLASSRWITLARGENIFTLLDDTPGSLEGQLSVEFREIWI